MNQIGKKFDNLHLTGIISKKFDQPDKKFQSSSVIVISGVREHFAAANADTKECC